MPPAILFSMPYQFYPKFVDDFLSKENNASENKLNKLALCKISRLKYDVLHQIYRRLHGRAGETGWVAVTCWVLYRATNLGCLYYLQQLLSCQPTRVSWAVLAQARLGISNINFADNEDSWVSLSLSGVRRSR